MPKLLVSYIFCLFLSLGGFVEAQNLRQSINYAQEAEMEGDFFGAQYYYWKALQLDSTNFDLRLNYANALRKANEYSRAAEQYEILTQSEEAEPQLLYYWAEMLEYTADYFKAINAYEEFLGLSTNKNTYEGRRAKQRIKSCQFALTFAKDSSHYQVLPVSACLNSIHTELAATKANDSSLLYTSIYHDTVKNNFTTTEQSLHGNIFKAYAHLDTLQIDSCQQLSFFSANELAGNPSIIQGDSLLFFSVCKGGNCAIYTGKLSDDSLHNPSALPEVINTAGFSSSQPFIFKENGALHLIYSSNKPGGKGFFDLYVATFDSASSSWNSKNLGPKINTPGNEITPFYDTTYNSLFFSSDWHEGLGGFDIFSASGDFKNLATPKALQPPFNTAVNDLYYRYYPSDSLHLLSSNRDGAISRKGKNCCNDIFYAQTFAPADTVLPDSSLSAPPKKDTLPLVSSVKELNEYLPVLYFPNDYPDPGTIKETSNANYAEIKAIYEKLIWEYAAKYLASLDGTKLNTDSVERAYENFYTTQIEQGLKDLELFCELLYLQLVSGEKVEITIKGYASPLASAAYNKKLTMRRIASMKNFILNYRNNKLRPFYEGESPQISFVEQPFGESKAKETVSDNRSDKKNAVYSLEAAKERKIEILSVTEK